MRNLRLNSARSEHGWNVAESQPSDVSKLSTETVSGAAPIPERPPAVTFVTVVSLMNPFSSFQNVCKKKGMSTLSSTSEWDSGINNVTVPGDRRGSISLGIRRKKHFPLVRSCDRGARQSARRGTVEMPSSTILPKRAGPKDPNCK